MENTLELFKSITGDNVEFDKSILYKAFNQLKDELSNKTTLDRDTKKISYLIQQLLFNKSFSNYTLSLLNLENAKENNLFTEFLIYTLVESSEDDGSQTLLIKILQGDNYAIKSYIFYHPTIYPIRKIFQTKQCKDAIISFVNSEKFKQLYFDRCKMPGYHSVLFAFPVQYLNCFDIKYFDSQVNKEISISKLSKLASKERLESIRVINDVFFKLILIELYYSQYLPTLYKTRFIRLVDKTFPELELKKNGYSYCL